MLIRAFLFYQHRPMKLPSSLTSLLLLSLCTVTAQAQLVFEAERIEHAATLEETSFTGHFHFTNRGSDTVRIGQIQSSCGCTVPSLEKREYAPGESGVIRTIFNFENRVGRQLNTIVVPTDQGIHYLSLEVNIPTRWTVSPRIQTWRLNTEPETKSIQIRFQAITPQSIRLAQSPDEERFSTETEWDAEAGVFHVLFTPQDMSKSGVLMSRVEVVEENGNTSSIPLYVRIY